MQRFLPLIWLMILGSNIVLADKPLHTGDFNADHDFISQDSRWRTTLQSDHQIADFVNQTSLDSLLQCVRYLSGEDSVTIYGNTYLIASRYAGHALNNIAADYLYMTLERLGLSAYDQFFGANGRNVFAVQTGTEYPDKKFIICAHYDSRPVMPAPGADDNASGTAAVLEAARILSKTQTPYTIIYALWDEEEQGLIGSNHYADLARQSGDDILGVINLDMIGWDGNNDGRFDIHTRPVANSLELADLTNFLEDEYALDLTPVIRNPGSGASDHAAFWSEGYGAILLIEDYYGGDFNPYYHSINDRVAHFNEGYFLALSQLGVAVISHLAFNSSVVQLAPGTDALPLAFALAQNYPNPFNPATTIDFQLSTSSDVALVIYDLLGQRVKTLVNESLPAGSYDITWNGQDGQGVQSASGVYYYRLTAGPFSETRKMVLIR